MCGISPLGGSTGQLIFEGFLDQKLEIEKHSEIGDLHQAAQFPIYRDFSLLSFISLVVEIQGYITVGCFMIKIP